MMSEIKFLIPDSICHSIFELHKERSSQAKALLHYIANSKHKPKQLTRKDYNEIGVFDPSYNVTFENILGEKSE